MDDDNIFDSFDNQFGCSDIDIDNILHLIQI